ncbi:hypothetical protein OC846_000364 [Tilletia horrida]|uniref:Protein kinase domain-containing protein n=1 Tax=Tilletia horrida TaxID=155126 RepID=A0AAN6JX26_9BASI|nr:hypothetical protein OC846_000364 [Tilletia horrida]
MSQQSSKRRRPAGFEPLVDLAHISLLPRRDVFSQPPASKNNNVALLEWHARGLTSSVYKTSLPIVAGSEQPRAVCVKVTSLDLLVRPHSAERELACLQHLRGSEHVAELIDAFVSYPDPFSTNYEMILDFYPFELGQLIDDPSFLPDTWATSAPSSLRDRHPQYGDFLWYLTTGLANGLKHMHKSGVAHRDIKPSNILLTQDGVPVYADFATAWQDYLANDSNSDDQSQYEGDNGSGGLEYAVGTGAFRAPELLFAPEAGYNVFKVDVWELGVTLSCCFLPFENTIHEKDDESSDGDGPPPLTGLTSSMRSERLWYEADPEDLDDRRTQQAPTRQMLFDGDRGEIALASSIFRILGLPEKQEDWPSSTFRPSFDRLPFDRSQPSGPISDSLPLIDQVKAHAKISAQVDAIVIIIAKALQLSASKRPTADQLVDWVTLATP